MCSLGFGPLCLAACRIKRAIPTGLASIGHGNLRPLRARLGLLAAARHQGLVPQRSCTFRHRRGAAGRDERVSGQRPQSGQTAVSPAHDAGAADRCVCQRPMLVTPDRAGKASRPGPAPRDRQHRFGWRNHTASADATRLRPSHTSHRRTNWSKAAYATASGAASRSRAHISELSSRLSRDQPRRRVRPSSVIDCGSLPHSGNTNVAPKVWSHPQSAIP